MITAISKNTLVARLTIRWEVGVDTLIEVHSLATFHAFYHFFSQQGRKTSTRKFVRTASRNEGILSYSAHLRPGLEMLALQWARLPHVKSVSVRIYKKRLYKKLIEANPSALGMSIVRPIFSAHKSYERPSRPMGE